MKRRSARLLPRLSCLLLLVLSLFAAAFLHQPVPASAASQITKVASGQGEVALTFDADAWPGRIDDILRTLKKHDTKLTFFFTATYLTNFPSRAKAIHNAGHEIASHGYEHRDYRTLSNAGIASRLDRWQTAFYNMTGEYGPMFWRAPYGYSDARVRQAALDNGYQTIYWNLDTRDTVGAPKSRSYILNSVLNSRWVNLDGAIVLMHVNSNGTVDALDEILSTLYRRGLKAVTVTELLDE